MARNTVPHRTTCSILLLITGLLLSISPVGAAAPFAPAITAPDIYRPAPWDIQVDHVKPGDSITARFNVTDINGSSTIDAYHANLSSPFSQQASFLDPEIETYLQDGYILSVSHDLSDTAASGDWNLTVWAGDTADDSSVNSTTFTVTAFQNVTLETTYNISTTDTQIVDDQTAQEQLYDASNLGFPYIISNAVDHMAGLVGYGNVLTVGYQEAPGEKYRLNMTQDYVDNSFLLPFTEARLQQLEQLQQDILTGDFLLSERPLIGYTRGETKTIRAELSYKNTSIALRGFDSSLGPGLFSLKITNIGQQDGQTLVQVIP